MKKFLLMAALGALLASPALAQPQDNHDRRGGNGGGNGGGSQNHAAPAAAPAAPAAAPAAQPRQTFDRRNDGGGPRPGGAMAGPNPNNQGANNRGNPGFNGPRPGNNNNNNFNGPRQGNNNFNGPRPGNNFNGARPGARPNFSSYNRNFTAPRRFRAPVYHRPPGFVYRRWVFGDFLPSIYWGSSYWLDDFSDFDLPPPPPGTVWVHYGSDALLIDRFSGEIIEVEYNVFY